MATYRELLNNLLRMSEKELNSRAVVFTGNDAIYALAPICLGTMTEDEGNDVLSEDHPMIWCDGMELEADNPGDSPPDGPEGPGEALARQSLWDVIKSLPKD